MGLRTKSITVHFFDGSKKTFLAEQLLQADLQQRNIVVRVEPDSAELERYFGLPLSTEDVETLLT